MDRNDELSLDEWAKLFYEKFPSIPGPGRAGENWLWYVGNIASPIAESIRLENFTKTFKQIGEALKWLCCFVEKYSVVIPGEKIRIRNSLSNIVWNKYCGMCYACAFLHEDDEVISEKYLPCFCSIIRAKIENREELITEEEKIINKNKLHIAKFRKPIPITLDQWGEMIRKIYEATHYDLSLSFICLHFIEEVGEVSKCIGKIEVLDPLDIDALNKSISELEDELADVFSWIFGLYNKINIYINKINNYYITAGCSKDIFPSTKISDLAKNIIREI